MISNNNDLIVDSSKKGLNIDYYSIPNTLYYDGYTIMNNNDEILWAKGSISYGSGLTEKFHKNTNETFFTEKKRYLLNDWDPAYQTFADTSTADFKGKITWSTTQELDWGCASYALAHLLWTYKINNVVDLTQNFVSAHALAQYFSVNYLHDQPVIGTLAVDVDNINPWLQGGYYIDFVDVSNGISDNLENAPIVGNYMADGGGHFALVTGKGRSVCGYFFGIKIYTSWDIVNTWGEYIPKRADINSLHGPQWKYWIDNQYIYFGWTLRDSSGNAVSL